LTARSPKTTGWLSGNLSWAYYSAKINPDIKRLRKLLDPFFTFELEVVNTEEYNEKQLQ